MIQHAEEEILLLAVGTTEQTDEKQKKRTKTKKSKTAKASTSSSKKIQKKKKTGKLKLTVSNSMMSETNGSSTTILLAPSDKDDVSSAELIGGNDNKKKKTSHIIAGGHKKKKEKKATSHKKHKVSTTRKNKTSRADSMSSETSALTASTVDSSSSDTTTNDPPAMVAATSSLSSSTMPTIKKSVSFDTVHVDEFEYTIGRSHVTKIGPPIGISTTTPPFASFEYNIDDYENLRVKERRGDDQLFLTARRRIELLQSLGYTQQEIQQAVNDSESVRNSRKRSVLNQQYDGLALTTELIGRKVSKLARTPKVLLTRTFSNNKKSSYDLSPPENVHGILIEAH